MDKDKLVELHVVIPLFRGIDLNLGVCRSPIVSVPPWPVVIPLFRGIDLNPGPRRKMWSVSSLTATCRNPLVSGH